MTIDIDIYQNRVSEIYHLRFPLISFDEKMRTMLKTLIAATNLPVRRYAVRFCSSDAQTKSKTDEKQAAANESESEPAKIEVVKKSKVIDLF